MRYLKLISVKLILRSKLCQYLCNILAVFSILLTNCLLSPITRAENNQDEKPWSVLLYRGNTAKQVFGEVITGKYSSFGESIYAAELAYTLDRNNVIRRFFHPVFDVVQVAGSLGYRHDYTNHDNVKEANLYMIWRFTKFPWSKYLKNSIAISDGFSYDSHPPFADREPGQPASNYNRLLNYLMLEVTFAMPSHPNFELALRVHHRCTAWGTFPKNANAGSTAVGAGIRYYF